jgi:hypothetical protein
MPKHKSVRIWLCENSYEDIDGLIEQVISIWKIKGKKTRRNWWDVLAGRENGTQRIIEGVYFPVLKAARLRKGWPVTEHSLCRNENENIPAIIQSNRWPSKEAIKEC